LRETGKTSFEDAVYGLQERDYRKSKTLFCCVPTVIRFTIWRSFATTSKWKSRRHSRARPSDEHAQTNFDLRSARRKTPPTFAHLPLILAPGGKKLSKRKHGEIVSMTTYRDAGFISRRVSQFSRAFGLVGGRRKEIYTIGRT
jgi:glutamyl-tRNA synthetase